jgi:hypothetical protein
MYKLARWRNKKELKIYFLIKKKGGDINQLQKSLYLSCEICKVSLQNKQTSLHQPNIMVCSYHLKCRIV